MENRYKAIVSVLFRLTDAAVVVAAWLAAYWARFVLPWVPAPKGLPSLETYASLVPLVVVLWTLVLSLSGVYEPSRLRSRRTEVSLLLQAHLVALGSFVVIAYTYDAYKYSRLVMFYFGAFGAVSLAGFRLALRTALRTLRARGRDVERALVVGDGHAARALVRRLAKFPELGVRVAGLITQRGDASEAFEGAPVVGAFEDVRRIVEDRNVHCVFVALPPHHQQEVPALLKRLGDATVRVAVVPDLQQFATLDYRVEAFDGMPVIRLNDCRLESIQSLVKRSIDVVLSLLGLLVFGPIMLIVAARIKATSPGPIIYAQERMGLDGRTFRMYKFRSMRVDAEAKSGAIWATKFDDRRTPIGAFLRRTSLDELPQLVNVLTGQMSLVGPRPERPVFVQQFRSQIPDYMLRHRVKAGITGWAQVNGWRGDTSLAERTACDLYYIRNWSLQLDLKILTMTIWKGFVNKNAY